jgi:methylated-DNA-[protein]-cysteine S-methyltransferase
MYYARYHSPLGLIEIGASATAVTSLSFIDDETIAHSPQPNPLLAEAERQLNAYFAGERRVFDLPLAPEGTPFQRRVWEQVGQVPFGRLASYHAIAEALANPDAGRAVGAANGRNPIALIIPCHRVIGRDGRLVGYAGGVWRKEWLLRHEGALLL